MKDKLPVGRMLIDAVAMVVLITGAGLAFGPAYGGARFLVALGVGALVGAVGALVPALLRWPAWTTLPLVLFGYLLFGGLAAAPRTTVAGVLPTLDTVQQLSVGVITSWKQMLTVAVPVGSGGTLLLPAFLCSVVLATVGTLVAVRTRYPLLALAAPIVMACGAAVLGSATPFHPAISGTVLALAAVVWAGWRRWAVGLPGLDLRRPLALAVLLVPAVAAGVLVGPKLVPDTAARAIARDIVQPDFDPTTLASPLSGYRNFVKKQKDEVLFTAHNLPADTPVRMVALDTYDGQVYSTSSDSGVFKRVGDRISGTPAGTMVDVDITVGKYDDVWAPSVGYLAGIRFTGQGSDRLQDGFRYNPETGTAVVTSGLRPGDEYSLSASIPARPSDEQLASAQLAEEPLPEYPADKIPQDVNAKAAEWTVGAEGPGQVAAAIAKKFRELGWVSHGSDSGPDALASAGGHGAGRIRQLLSAKVMSGDAEQYAVAMALMLWTKKIPARVVMGFRPQEKGGTVQLKGEAMTAWVEVPLVDYGWVSFNPVPDEGKELPESVPDENPQVFDPDQVQVPPQQTPAKDATVQSADSSSNSATKASGKKEQKKQNQDPPPADQSGNWWWLLLIGLGVLLLVLPVLLILLLKYRRRRRLAAGTPDQRVAGAWTHLLDTATDFGRPPPKGATRVEIAKDLDRVFAPRHVVTADGAGPRPAGPAAAGPVGAVPVGSGPVGPRPVPDAQQARASVAVLARQADSRVFAPDAVAPDDADRYWTEMEQAIAALRGSQSGWRRVRARLNLASLRRKDRR